MSENKPEKQEITRDDKGRFVEGVSGNPNGRPPFSLITMLKAELQKCPSGQDKITYADMLIKRILKEAIESGDSAQIKNILNYVEGMPKQPVEMSGSVDTRLEILTRMGLVDDNETKRLEEQASETSGD